MESTGIQEGNEVLKINKIVCYPNPAATIITVDRSSLIFNEKLPVTYTLVSLNGEKVMEFDKQDLQFSIPLDVVVNGVYSLTAKQGANRATAVITVTK